MRRTAAHLGLVLAAVLAVGLTSGAFASFPTGNDTWGHLAKVNLLRADFPNVQWNDAWYAGSPAFAGSYPPLFHLVVLAGSVATGWAASSVIVGVGVASVIALVTGTWLTVWFVTRSRAAATAAALLLAGSPTVWSQLLVHGLYPRLLGSGLVALAAAATVRYAQTARRSWWFASVTLTTAALLTHLLLGALAVLVVAGIVVASHRAPRLWRRVVRGVVTVGTAGALAGVFWVPYALDRRPPQPLETVPPAPPLTELVWPASPSIVDSLSTLLLPTIVVLLVLAARGRAQRHVRDAVPFGVLALGVAAYSFSGHLGLHIYINAIHPQDVLVYVAYGGAVTAGVFAAAVLGPRARTALVAVTALAIPLAALQVGDAAVRTDDPAKAALEASLPADLATDRDHRVAGAHDAVTKWLNAVSTARQTRGYQAQAILEPDWQAWVEHALQDPALDAERHTVLDWWAVRWLAVFDTPANTALFADDRRYERVGSAPATVGFGPWAWYEVRDTGPIAAATSTPAVLVIGNPDAYDVVLRTLAMAGLDSADVIPVEGGTDLDRFDDRALAAFDAVVVYGDGTFDAEPLERFVRAGGGLLVEDANRTRGTPGDPWPVRATQQRATGATWRFSDEAPRWQATPFALPTTGWSVRSAGAVASWATPLARSDGAIVAAAGGLGRGRVVWTGVNLPYHARATATVDEADLFASLLQSVLPPRRPAQSVPMERLDPEHRTVDAPAGANGVLLKETWDARWRATVDGEPTPIHRAGPGFMWVPLDGPARVTVTAGRTTAELLGLGTSVLAVALLALFALGAPFDVVLGLHVVGGRRWTTSDPRPRDVRPSRPDGVARMLIRGAHHVNGPRQEARECDGDGRRAAARHLGQPRRRPAR